jgi:hypothetical protein
MGHYMLRDFTDSTVVFLALMREAHLQKPARVADEPCGSRRLRTVFGLFNANSHGVGPPLEIYNSSWDRRTIQAAKHNDAQEILYANSAASGGFELEKLDEDPELDRHR